MKHCFKPLRPGDAPQDQGFVLKRVSALARTVRYEWLGCDDVTYYGPAFQATAQEWDRARD